jgi:hypothetical protein
MSAEATAPEATRVDEVRRGVARSRLAARAPRHLASAGFIVLALLGLRTIFLPAHQVAATPRPAAASDLPSEDFADQFARAYLSYDAAEPAAREKALAPYLSSGLSAGAGFDAESGSRRVLWEDVASDQPALQGGRVITVAAEVNGQSAPLYLAVTVRHRSGRPLSLIGYPALVGAPAIASSVPETARQAVTDPEVTEVVGRVLRNYLAGSAPDLRADLTDDAQVTLPTVSLQVRQVSGVEWVAGPGSGAVLATATAEGPEGDTYTLTYELGIAWRERPYVDFIEVVPTRS